MITYELYDDYGTKQAEYDVAQANMALVIVKHGGDYYRPICHDISGDSAIAKCIPVKVIDLDSQGEEQTNGKIP